MTFLQPFILFAIPFIALPILIHLINQNRHKTIYWAATRFLLEAKRMSRGMARLRYILILIARMLAVAGLIFAISRPMAGGWLGFTAGATPDTTIILLDRSASMEQKDNQTGKSKRETALNKLSELIKTTGRNTKLVLFDSASPEPLEISSAKDLLDLPETQPTAMSANVPAMLQSAGEYIVENETGRTDVWVLSDLQANDWNPDGGLWESIRGQLAERDGVKLYLLTYPEVPEDNLAVRVSGVHRRETAQGAEIVMDLRVTRTGTRESALNVPLGIVVNGARTTLDIEIAGNEFILNGYSIPIDTEQKRGWGRIELPDDSNTADNIDRFVYAEPAVQRTAIVSDNDQVSKLFQLAAGTPANTNLQYDAVVYTSSRAATIPWKATGLIIWHAPLPTGPLATQLEQFLEDGKSVLFYPPESPTDDAFLETTWGNWKDVSPTEGGTVNRWRTDSDLLANSQDGSPLPVGQLQISQFCELNQETATSLASLKEGEPLVTRLLLDQGAAYFCATLPSRDHSNLIENGIVFYVMLQRALARGASVLGAARQLDAGAVSESTANDWTPLVQLSENILLSSRPVSAGLYESEDTLYALNRPSEEDNPRVVGSDELAKAMGGLDYTVIQDEAGSRMALASEIWKTFLIAMIAALLLEALLCLPERQAV